MGYKATVYKVFIASPNDVPTEREIVRDLVYDWNTIHADSSGIVLLPVGWETHSVPEMGGRPQQIIDKQILKDCDLVVGVFGARIGSPTGQYLSGTVEEIEEHINAGKPAMLYFSDAPIARDRLDFDQLEKVKSFQRACEPRGLIETYSDPKNFREKFSRQLQMKVNKDPYFRSLLQADESESDHDDDTIILNIPKNLPDLHSVPEMLSEEAQTLLVAAATSPDGDIVVPRWIGGQGVRVNKREFIEDNNPRSIAVWEAALEELERLGFIKPLSYKREIFTVTRSGYDYSDSITKASAQAE